MKSSIGEPHVVQYTILLEAGKLAGQTFDIELDLTKLAYYCHKAATNKSGATVLGSGSVVIRHKRPTCDVPKTSTKRPYSPPTVRELTPAEILSKLNATSTEKA